MTDVYLNGRFLSQPFTGVQRFATEVILELDRILDRSGSSNGSLRYRILTPPGAVPKLHLERIAVTQVGRLRGGVPWEQIELPVAARGGLLVNLGSTGPIAHPNQIITIHDASVYRVPENFSWAFRAWYRFLIPVLGKRAKTILTVSEFSKSELTTCCAIPSQKIVVVHNAANQIHRQPADDSILNLHDLNRGGYLLCVGAGRVNKNTDLVLRALRWLDDSELHLVRVGETDPNVFASTDLAHDPRVHDVGGITDAQLRALYENAFCFVFPSKYEGFGIPPLEAMACRCPVIAANSSALPEICADAALYCDPNDAKELADKINLLTHERELRTQLVDRGIRRAAGFRWEHTASRLIEEIARLTGPD